MTKQQAISEAVKMARLHNLEIIRTKTGAIESCMFRDGANGRIEMLRKLRAGAMAAARTIRSM